MRKHKIRNEFGEAFGECHHIDPAQPGPESPCPYCSEERYYGGGSSVWDQIDHVLGDAGPCRGVKETCGRCEAEDNEALALEASLPPTHRVILHASATESCACGRPLVTRTVTVDEEG